MEELKKFQRSTFDAIARRRLVEEDTILELTGKIQDLQNEINCLNNSRDFQDAESTRSGNSHVASRPVFPTCSNSCGGMVLLECRAAEKGHQAFGTHMVYRETFLQIQRRLFQHLIRKGSILGFSNVSEHTSPHVTSEFQTQDAILDSRCQSRQSAKNSIILSEGDSSKNYGTDQQRLQISDLHFDKFTTPATFACCKIRFKTEVCTCSQFLTEAMHWMEMVDSVDDLKSSCSVRGIQMPNFEVFDAKIASVLNTIIQNSHFKRTISLEEQKVQKEDRFLRGRQIAYLIYESFLVTGANDSVRIVPSSSILVFEMTIFRYSIRNGTEFSLPVKKITT